MAHRKQSVKTRSLPSAIPQQANLNAILSSIGEGMIATDEHATVTLANQKALDILEYDSDKDLIGQWFPDAVVALKEDGSLVEVLDRAIERVFITGQTISDRTYYMTARGNIIPVALTVSPIIVNGQPRGAIQAFRDITSELQSDKLKTEFISIASHQLRTPLTAVNMYSQMLTSGIAGKLNPTQRSFVETIIGAAGRMNELINTLLNITRIEAGSITVTSKPTDIKELATDLMKELDPQAKGKKLSLKLSMSSMPIIVNTDGLLVKEVFANLLTNALKFTPPKGTIRARLTRTKRHVQFSVSDTGYGIPRADQPYIFTKFFRAENITSHDVSGTGLGLYLTKMIAENLGGEMWFDSTEGSGSTFTFWLPLTGSTSKTGKFKLDA